jgi:hypothetical protein
MNGNWIYQTTTTTGTGNLTLSAVSGYPQISSQFAASELFKYQILDDTTGAPLEQGIGYIDGSGNLVRSKPQATMTAGTYDGTGVSAVSLPAGTKKVIVALGAQSSITSTQSVYGVGVRGYGDAQFSSAVGTISPIASLSYAIPFIAAVDADVDAIVCRVTSANGQSFGGEVKASIWSYGADGLPAVKLVEGVTTVSNTGLIVIPLSSATRPPSRFFVIFTSALNYTMQGHGGYSGIGMMGTDNSMVPISAITKAGSGADHPADWTSPSLLTGTTSRPQLIARCVQ